MKRIFKFRQFGWKWFRFYIFPRDNYGVGIGFWTTGDGDYALFYIKLIIASFEITFAPNSWFIEDKLIRDKWIEDSADYFYKVETFHLKEEEYQDESMMNKMKDKGFTNNY